MPRFRVPKSEFRLVEVSGKKYPAISKAAFESFNISVLGLGNVSAPSEPTDAVAAVFDLAGFTNFCKQIEPHLSVPHYLNAFLTWLMRQIREEMLQAEAKDTVRLGCPLPFFVKFLGDGLVVLWNSKEMNDAERRNVLIEMHRVCQKYVTEFLPTLRGKIVDAPRQLRCGMARGTVFSVGEGEDYVGSCINMAARVQKLPGISYCFNRRGFEIEISSHSFFTQKIVIKRVSIRGIGDHELVCVLRSELESLSAKDQKIYQDPA
jgi:class 3 adenylate cyclase